MARRLRVDPAYQVVLPGSGGNAYYFVGLDTSIPTLADKRVRRAFNYALNRQRMVDVALAGYGRAASTVWPPDLPPTTLRCRGVVFDQSGDEHSPYWLADLARGQTCTPPLAPR